MGKARLGLFELGDLRPALGEVHTPGARRLALVGDDGRGGLPRAS